MAQMKRENCTTFLAFTANLVASGVRGVLAELCAKKFAGAVVTTAGAIDHDVIKCFGNYELGSFNADDAELHSKGINRIGNIFAENRHFENFEKFMMETFSELCKNKKTVSPRELNAFIGEKLAKEKNSGGSFLAQCAKNNVPVFCPGITDGAIGLQGYFFKQDNKEFGIDVTADMQEIADLVLGAEKTAAVVLGGGIAKHFTLGANLLREGLDYAVYFTTAQEYDGSLSGAQTREAKSWGKLKEKARSVTVYGDATINFPLAVAALKEQKLI